MAWDYESVSAHTMSEQRSGANHGSTPQHLARKVLVAFMGTFVIARIVVLLIMTRNMPDLFIYVGGTHVHHLNYGIFLLSGVGAYLLFREPSRRVRETAAVAYGVGLALTFDEFGMWLHLGGGYWQRASFDAVVVIAAALGLVVVAPSIKRFRPRHWITGIALAFGLAAFLALLVDALRYASSIAGPKLLELEAASPK